VPREFIRYYLVNDDKYRDLDIIIKIRTMPQKDRHYREFIDTSPADVRLSCWECEDLIDAVNDDRLSPSALMKFKNLFRAHSFQLLVIPAVTFPVAWFFNRWLVGNCYIIQASLTEDWLVADSTSLAWFWFTLCACISATTSPSPENTILNCWLTVAMTENILETALLTTSLDFGKKYQGSLKAWS